MVFSCAFYDRQGAAPHPSFAGLSLAPGAAQWRGVAP